MAGVRRGEEQNGIGDLLRAGDFTQRDAELKLLAEAADPLLLCIVADPQGALHIGIGGARRHQITAHPAARQLKPDGQRRAFQRRLRGAIGAHADARRVRSIGGDGDDRPAPLATELGHRLLKQVERPADVDREGLLPVFRAQLVGSAHAQDPGGVHQHVQSFDVVEQPRAQVAHRSASATSSVSVANG